MTRKLKKFLFSDEFFELVNKLDEILNINPNQDFERDSKVVIFLDTYFREKLAGESLINYLKTNFDWLSEEELNKFLDFIQQNLFQKREELWKEEIQEKEPEITILKESLEEREKKYLELMKNIIKLPQKEKPIEEISPSKTEEEINKKTIVLESKEEKLGEEPIVIKSEEKEEKKIELPEETIIIKKYKEEKEEKEGETVDLSKI